MRDASKESTKPPPPPPCATAACKQSYRLPTAAQLPQPHRSVPRPRRRPQPVFLRRHPEHRRPHLTKDMETSEWTVPPLVRDSFSMIGSAVGGTVGAFMASIIVHDPVTQLMLCLKALNLCHNSIIAFA